MGRTSYVYALRDPFLDRVMYVGSCRDPEVRFKKHLTAPSGRVAQWVKFLQSQGAQPELEILTEADEDEVLDVELRAIRKHADESNGFLCNKVGNRHCGRSLSWYIDHANAVESARNDLAHRAVALSQSIFHWRRHLLSSRFGTLSKDQADSFLRDILFEIVQHIDDDDWDGASCLRFIDQLTFPPPESAPSLFVRD